jgi:hypothetical protein
MTVQSLVGRSASTLTTSASTPADLATRYALFKLNAFVANKIGKARQSEHRLARKMNAAYYSRSYRFEDKNSLREAA